MKMVSGYLILLTATIGILALSMVWQLQSFQQNLSRLSFSLPTPSQMPSLDINQELQKITDQAATQTSGTPKEFATPDKSLTFSYSPLWQQTQSGSLPQGQGTVLFSANRVNISQLSIAYLTVTQLALADKDAVISQLENQAGGNGKIKITDDGPLTVKNGTIEVLDAVYDLGAASPTQTSSMNAKIAIATLKDKSYVIGVYGSPAAWETLKTEADTLFASMQFSTPAGASGDQTQTPAQQ